MYIYISLIEHDHIQKERQPSRSRAISKDTHNRHRQSSDMMAYYAGHQLAAQAGPPHHSRSEGCSWPMQAAMKQQHRRNTNDSKIPKLASTKKTGAGRSPLAPSNASAAAHLLLSAAKLHPQSSDAPIPELPPHPLPTPPLQPKQTPSRSLAALAGARPTRRRTLSRSVTRPPAQTSKPSSRPGAAEPVG